MDAPIELQLSIHADTLTVVVRNRGETEVRLWDRNNSWGWGMFSLRVAAPGSAEWSELTPRPVRHTRNGPRARTIPPGGRLEYELRPEDPAWEGTAALAGSRAGPLNVKVRLRIPETPEAIEQKVFIGEAESAPVLSTAPHGWLA